MPVELFPAGDFAQRAAVLEALARTGLDLAAASDPYDRPWRRVALVEGVEQRLGWSSVPGSGYALSPRSTRGATRA